VAIPTITDHLADPQGVTGWVAIFASVNGPGVAYAQTGGGETIGGRQVITFDTSGNLKDRNGQPLQLNPNSGTSTDVITEPSGTVWQYGVRYPGQAAIIQYLSVPDDASTHAVSTILTDPPGSLPSSALEAETTRAMAAEASKLPLAGGTLTGLLTLAAAGFVLPVTGGGYNVVTAAGDATDGYAVIFRDPGTVTGGLITPRYAFQDHSGNDIWGVKNDGGTYQTDSLSVVRGSALHSDPAYTPQLRLVWLNASGKRAMALVAMFQGTGGTTVTDHGDTITLDAGVDSFIRLLDTAQWYSSRDWLSGGDLYARAGGWSGGANGLAPTKIGSVGPSGEPGIMSGLVAGSSAARWWHPSGVNWQTDGGLIVAGQIQANGGITGASTEATSFADPTVGTSLATKNYVDTVATGLQWHHSVVCATAAALAASTYNNGTAGVGATLTSNSNIVLAMDGGTIPNTGDRVLVKNQATAAQNGIYTVTQQGSGSQPFILTRATDADQAAEVSAGLTVYVLTGTANADTTWALTTTGAFTIGTTGWTFAQVAGPGSYLAGTGLTLTGSTFAVAYGTSAGTALQGNQAAGGDLAGTLPSPTLAAFGPGAIGPYGDSSHVPAVTTDAKGRISAMTQVAISASAIGALVAANNLSDVANAGTARANLQEVALASVRCMSDSNVASLSGTGATMDGATLAANDRVLLTAQSTASQNGVWVVNSGAWTRPTDFPSGAVVTGRVVLVTNGTTYTGTAWWLTATGAGGLTVDTNSQTWVQSVTAGTGLSNSGKTLSVANNGVTNAMLAQAAAYTIKGNLTNATANEADSTLDVLVAAISSQKTYGIPLRHVVSSSMCHVGGNTTTGAPTLNQAFAIPYIPDKTATATSLNVWLVTLISNGQIRLGIYNDNTLVPGTVLVDGGQVATSTSSGSVKSVTISQSLTAGTLYWLVGVAQTASATMTLVNAADWALPGPGTSIQGSYCSYSMTGVSGSLGTWSGTTQSPNPFKISVGY